MWGQALQMLGTAAAAADMSASHLDPLVAHLDAGGGDRSLRQQATVIRLQSALEDKAAGTADIAYLMRQCVLEFAYAATASPIIPVGDRMARVLKSRPASDAFLLRGNGPGQQAEAIDWTPNWLARSGGPPPMTQVLRRLTRQRSSSQVASDPFYADLTQWSTYVSVAQRDLLDRFVQLPGGQAMLATLPTGGGKTSIFLVPALLSSRFGPRGVSVVFVPTIALALDLESRLAPFFDGRPIAYTHETSASDARRLADAIRSGTQPLLVISPESGLGRFRSPLLDCAQAGLLRSVILDEAHMVVEWGTRFRWHYQGLAGLVARLWDASSKTRSPFKLLMLTATITESQVEQLRSLFGAFEEVYCDVLRPEPEYWFTECEGEEQRMARVLEAARALPKPMIIFTSLPSDAKALRDRLVLGGLKRVATFTGEDPLERRQCVLAEFRGAQVDIVVGTSAFGLGVDIPNVRTVLHACLPESIARFYQEVGRGGRDGDACGSVVLWTKKPDEETAEGLGIKKVATGPTAQRYLNYWRTFGRWDQDSGSPVFLTRAWGDPDPQSAESPRENFSNSGYREWHREIACQLARYSFIELDIPVGEASIDDVLAFRPGVKWDEDVARLVDQARVAELGARQAALSAMMELVQNPTPSVCTVLADYFAKRGTPPAHSCGGCPDCRAKGRPPTSATPTAAFRQPSPRSAAPEYLVLRRSSALPNWALGKELTRLLAGLGVRRVLIDPPISSTVYDILRRFPVLLEKVALTSSAFEMETPSAVVLLSKDVDSRWFKLRTAGPCYILLREDSQVDDGSGPSNVTSMGPFVAAGAMRMFG